MYKEKGRGDKGNIRAGLEVYKGRKFKVLKKGKIIMGNYWAYIYFVSKEIGTNIPRNVMLLGMNIIKEFLERIPALTQADD